jgi:hypothetical protein
MALYTHAARTSNVTTGAACWELRSSATDRVRVREIGITLAAATASSFGLGRPAAIGVTPTSPVTVVAEDTGEPTGTAQTALAWGTGPTIPAVFLRRIGFPATIGSGIIWSWWNGPGLLIPVSSSLILWNLATNGVSDVYVVLDE